MDENLSVGEVINGTLAEVADNAAAAVLFVAVFTGLGTAIEWGLAQQDFAVFDQVDDAGWLLALFGIGAGIGGILFIIISVIGQYLLWEAMLKRRNYLVVERGRRFLAFFGLAILTGLGIGLGFLLLVIPGLIFSARWAMAPAFLIVERRGIVDSMGGSWDEVKGNTTPIVLAILAAVVLIVAISFAVGAGVVASGNDTGEIGLVESVAGQLISQVGTLLSVGLGTFLFGRLHGSSEQLSGVFE